MPKINGPGLAVGLVVWLILAGFMVSRSHCLTANSCGADDLMLSAILGIGMIGPVWIVAGIVSAITGSE